MILLVDNYDSFTYNVKQAIEQLGLVCRVYRNDALTVKHVEKLKPRAIVISPGPGNPSSAGVTLDLISHFASKLPMLGICLGHQAMGQAFGGNVIHAPRPFHGKVSTVLHTGKGMFKKLPPSFEVARYHSLIVERKTLPECFEVTAQTKDGLIMAMKHKKYPMEGLQFHPESVATPQGMHLLQNFFKS